MDRLFKPIIIFSCLVSGFVLIPSWVIILLVSFNLYPARLWLFVPWLFGVYGVIGLYASLKNDAHRSGNELTILITLLTLGIVGAVTFEVILYWALLRFGHGLSSPNILEMIMIFPVLPIIGGILCIARHWSQLRRTGNAVGKRINRFFVIALLVPLCLVLSRIILQEAIMLWYGLDLADKARHSAELLAEGRDYCLVDRYGATSFEELDHRRILARAFEQRFVFHFGGFIKEPHFGLYIEGKSDYWWSFMEGRFVESGYRDYMNYTCNKDG